MNNEYLDIIKYISFRVKRKGSLKIVTLPIAYKEKSELTEYLYDISNEKYYKFMTKIDTSFFSPHSCNIYTIFGNNYNGYFSLIDSNDLKIHSHEKMGYKNLYFDSIKNIYKRFRLMEI